MMNDVQVHTLGGAICGVLASITLGDVFQTMLMAAVGTLVSFLTSRLLRYIGRCKRDN